MSGGIWRYIRLLRPTQWTKNAFVLAPLIFSGLFADTSAVAAAFGAFGLFCLASSAAYVLNDLRDREADAKHPDKRHRPLANGSVTPRAAFVLLGGLWAAVAAAVVLWPAVGAVAAGYVLLNLAYSYGLKRVPVIDLFVVSAGFALRVFAGAFAIAVPVSSWMLVATLSLSLFLVTMKRRAELMHQGDGARSVLGAYSVNLLDRYATVAATSTIVFYGLFVATVRPELAATLPLVLLGVFRYWYLMDQTTAGETPTDVLVRDVPMLLTVLAYGALAVALVIRAGTGAA